MIRIKKIASMPTRPKLKSLFASEPKCIVHGTGKKCVTGKLPSYKKAEFVFAKLANLINFKLLMPALSKAKVHKNTQGVIVDIIGHKSRLTNLANKNPERAIEEAFKVLRAKNPHQVNLIYTPQGHKALKGIGAGKYGEYVFNKMAGPATYYAIMKEITKSKVAVKNLRHAIKATSDSKGLKMYIGREKKMLNKIDRLKTQITN